MRFLDRWRVRKKKKALHDLLALDKKLRDVPGETARHFPDAMLDLGHRIAMLRFEIAQLDPNQAVPDGTQPVPTDLYVPGESTQGRNKP